MESVPVLQKLEIDEAETELDSADPEARLVDGLLEGSREAAEALVDRTYGLVYAALARLCGGNSTLASDLTQETYRKAWASLAAFERRARFSTWLYRIAYNTFLNHTRGANRTTSLDAIPSFELRDSRPDQEERLYRREAAARLRYAVLALPEDLRFTITARFWGEVPVREIASSERISEVAVRKRIRKAIAAVREALDEGADT